MALLIPIYIIITAVSAVLALAHMKLLFAFYIAACALLAVAAGDEMRGVVTQGTSVQKLVRAMFAVAILLLSLWFGMRCVIDLHIHYLSGTTWSFIGAVCSFFANQQYMARPERRRFRRITR